MADQINKQGYKLSNGSLYKYSERSKAYIHLCRVPVGVKSLTQAIAWYKEGPDLEELINRRKSW